MGKIEIANNAAQEEGHKFKTEDSKSDVNDMGSKTQHVADHSKLHQLVENAQQTLAQMGDSLKNSNMTAFLTKKFTKERGDIANYDTSNPDVAKDKKSFLDVIDKKFHEIVKQSKLSIHEMSRGDIENKISKLENLSKNRETIDPGDYKTASKLFVEIKNYCDKGQKNFPESDTQRKDKVNLQKIKTSFDQIKEKHEPSHAKANSLNQNAKNENNVKIEEGASFTRQNKSS